MCDPYRKDVITNLKIKEEAAKNIFCKNTLFKDENGENVGEDLNLFLCCKFEIVQGSSYFWVKIKKIRNYLVGPQGSQRNFTQVKI